MARRRKKRGKVRRFLLLTLLAVAACLLYQQRAQLEPVGTQLQVVGAQIQNDLADLGVSVPDTPQPSTSEPTWHSWNPYEAPNYYQEMGPAVFFLEEPALGEVAYGNLDLLGRATGASANVTYSLMQEGLARNRDNMGNLEPSGWGTNDTVSIPLPNGDAYHGYFWNRSHLVAKSLGGLEDLRNLITGTRMQNVGANDGSGGMAFCESLCRTWLEQHPEGSVHYEAVPVYEGLELVPRSVLVSMRSSDGAIDLQVEVFNAALGFQIDYATGTFAEA